MLGAVLGLTLAFIAGFLAGCQWFSVALRRVVARMEHDGLLTIHRERFP